MRTGPVLRAPRAGEKLAVLLPGMGAVATTAIAGVAAIRRKIADPVANKTGALDALRSDVGIVYSKRGRIAMAITVDDMPKTDYTPDNAGLLLIAEMAKMIVDGLAGK